MKQKKAHLIFFKEYISKRINYVYMYMYMHVYMCMRARMHIHIYNTNINKQTNK